ncbi:calmodulin binding protein PICBP isoform X2 [Syzygium oleosum]|uniref:calmodulin binding protein PICBP isoform X2 n=1 Tax=Syzygium oleosum TaxID=219896 RepID=UPI0024B96B2C|nr:calmodulin binding protein PICBP isoform X2 [Syzygium oleosum]
MDSLSSWPSMESSRRSEESQSGYNPVLDCSSDGAASEWSTSIETSDASPDRTEATACSDAKAYDLQKPARTLTRRSSLRLAKGLTRMSSSIRRSSSKKISGVADLQRKKLKKLRSIRLAGFQTARPSRRNPSLVYDQPLSSSSDMDALPSYLKSTRCSDVKKVNSQASPLDSELSVSSNDQSGKFLNSVKPKQSPSGNKSVKRFTRTPTLRPVGILTKMASLKPKRPSVWKRQQISQSSDLSILRPTCSSAIRGKKIPDQPEIPQEGHLSERNLAKKFCPYSYCSLHGHHRHGEAPTLKHLKSARKRVNAQRSKKLAGQPPRRVNNTGNSVKGNESSKIVYQGQQAIEEKGNVTPTVQKLKREVPVEIYTGPKADPNGVVAQDGGEVNSDSLGLVDVESVEIMSPHESSGESIQQACLYSEEQHVLVPPLALNDETHMELRRSGSELELCIADSNNTQKNKEEISSVSCDTGGGNVALDEDQAASPVVCQLKPEDGGGFSHDLSSKSTDITETCHSEDPQDINIVREVYGEEPSCLESELHLTEPTINGGNTTVSDSMADELACTSDICISSKESARATKDELSSVSEVKGENAAPQIGDSEPDDPFRTPRGTKKYNGLWNLIYQHMVSDIAESGGLQPFNPENEKERVKEGSTLPGVDGADHCQEVSEYGQYIETPTNEEDRQPIELCQSDAIKLLQEAINKLLLSQSPVQKFDSQSTGNDTDMEEQCHSDGKDGSRGAIGSLRVSTSPELQNGAAPESKEEQLGSANLHTKKEQTETKIWNKPNQPTLKRWSNVKKLILLKRFIKAMDKTRKFKPRMPRSPSSDLYPEAEKVNLRRQSTEERKKSEEWMLDYALRKVISNLDPAQKRKVALLVEAFETVVPSQGAQSSISTNSSLSSPVRHAKAIINCSVLDDKPKGSEDGYSSRTLTGKSSSTHPVDQSSDSATEELENPVAFSKAKITGQDFCTIGRELSMAIYEENPMKISFSSPDVVMTKSTIASDLSDQCLKAENSENEIDIESSGDGNVQEERARKTPSSNLPPEGADAGSNRKSSETEGLMGEKVTIFNDSKGDSPEDKEESEPDNPSPVGGKKYNGLWYLIYQHMVSDIAESGGSQTFNLENEKEHVKDGSTLPGVDEADHRQEVSEGCQGIEAATDDADRQQMELCQSDAIKLLQEAVNKILLSQSPDQKFDSQSTANDTKLEERCHSDEKDGSSGETKSPGISTSLELQNGAVSDSKEEQVRTENLHTMKEQTKTKIWHKPNQPTLNRWSSVKKFILLKKFVKALEKTRNFKPRMPRSPPLELYTESEKVSLRQQSIEERKKSEEWMLDHALRRVISNLDPAQKRKVALLVEAFETVVPTQGVQDDKPIAIEDGHSAKTLTGKPSRTFPIAQSSNSSTKEQQKPVAFSEAKGTGQDFCTISRELSREVYDENLMKISFSGPNKVLSKSVITGDISDQYFKAENSENVQERTRKTPNLNSTPEGADAGSNSQSSETKGSLGEAVTVFNNSEGDSPEDDNAESTHLKGSSPLASVDDTSKEPMTTSQEGEHGVSSKDELLSDSSSLDESMPIRVTNAEQEVQLENKKYSSLWYLIHKHMVSGLHTEDGSRSPLDGTSKDDEEEENKLDRRYDSCQHSPEAKDQQTSLGQRADCEKMELRKIEAIKLVQEAIDNILLPEAEEGSSDGQFSSKNIHYEKTECAETLISALNNSADDGRVEPERTEQPRASDQETQLQFITVSGASQEADRTEPKVASKRSEGAVKNWSNLKKVILLKRFVKALEKVRNLNLQKPQHLPPQPHDEPEKVNLRHQDKDGRKNTEEWMLDYALQQVVFKLTPTRRRKVHLLVEAFETVSPPVGN